MATRTYRFLVRLAALPAFGYTLWMARRRGDGRYLHQRLGRSLPRGPVSLWVHCASVGEVRAAAPLVRKLAADQASGSLLVTTNTPTGAQAAERDLPEGVRHCYLPLDLPGPARRFLDRVRPRCALVVETELWPNLFAGCERLEIPLLIVNGRISPRTLEAPRWLRNAYGCALRSVTACLARSEEDADRFRTLGMAPERTRVLGSLKFAQTAGMEGKGDTGSLLDGPYLLGGSTREGEEVLLARVWKRLGDRHRVLVLAPRHPDRREDILRELHRVTDRIAVRSRGEPVTGDTEIYLA
ncbi:MAG TPA: glycosyltransferase N-terminal domain-containing protein, partial [Gammaproteobacteria bacterium]|nr:glycosyltransferase N-terminal domain-containing protein [Gammaproteobacteria bacterium]